MLTVPSVSWFPFPCLLIPFYPAYVCIPRFSVVIAETRGHSIEDIVLEVRHRTSSLSTGRPWEANRSSSRLELQRLLDSIEQRIYDSTDDLFE